MEQAIEIYNDVAKDGGSLALRARLSQAMLFNSLGRPKDALGVLENIVSSNPDAELRNMALVEQGDTWFSLGVDDPQNFSRAIESWQKIVSDSSASKEWNHQALVKMGGAYAKLGNNDAALDCYYRVFSQDQKGQPEYFWFYKAGFEAGSLLERQKLWKEAIAVYEKIGSFDGPRAGEARDRVNKLRLENFIWEN
jgi:tetratricopeptide (TPR) repeat protein